MKFRTNVAEINFDTPANVNLVVDMEDVHYGPYRREQPAVFRAAATSLSENGWLELPPKLAYEVEPVTVTMSAGRRCTVRIAAFHWYGAAGRPLVYALLPLTLPTSVQRNPVASSRGQCQRSE